MGTIMVPKNCKAGFQERRDTYSGKLAYVIYYDEKNVLRKEGSWSSWRDNKIEPIDFENVPTTGFFVNRDVGGHKSGWDYRQSYCRIYDPRGFEIEITIPNLIYILKNTNCLKEKGFEGEFVYGWDGKDLILVPTEAPEYLEIKEKTAAVYDVGFIKAKDLVEGYTYATLDGTLHVYLTKDYKYSYTRVFKNNYNYYRQNYSEYSIDGMTKEQFEKLPRSLDRPDERILITKSSKKVYWFYNKSTNTITSFSSLDKKLYNTVEANISKDISRYMNELYNNINYSKIDYSKDELKYYTLEEFINKIKTRNTYAYCSSWVNFYDVSGKRWVIRGYETFFEIDDMRNQKFLFEDETSFERVFNMIKPIKLNIHTLENGHTYNQLMWDY